MVDGNALFRGVTALCCTLEDDDEDGDADAEKSKGIMDYGREPPEAIQWSLRERAVLRPLLVHECSIF